MSSKARGGLSAREFKLAQQPKSILGRVNQKLAVRQAVQQPPQTSNLAQQQVNRFPTSNMTSAQSMASFRATPQASPAYNQAMKERGKLYDSYAMGGLPEQMQQSKAQENYIKATKQADELKDKSDSFLQNKIESFRETAGAKLKSFFGRPDKEVAKDVYSPVKDLAIGTARLPFTIPTKVLTTLNRQKQFTPENKVEKTLLGDEPISSYTEDQKKITQWAKDKGIESKSSIGIGAVGAIGEIGMDLFPGTGGESKVGKEVLAQLAKHTATKDIEETLLKQGLKATPEAIDLLKGIKTPGGVSDALKSFEKSGSIFNLNKIKSAAIKVGDTVYEGSSHAEAIKNAPSYLQEELMKNKDEIGGYVMKDGSYKTRADLGGVHSEEVPQLKAQQDMSPADRFQKDINDTEAKRKMEAEKEKTIAENKQVQKERDVESLKQDIANGKLNVQEGGKIKTFETPKEEGALVKARKAQLELDRQNRMIGYTKQGTPAEVSREKMFGKEVIKNDVQKTFENAVVDKGGSKKSLWQTVKEIFNPVSGVKEGTQIKNAFREYAAKYRFDASQSIKNSTERMNFWKKLSSTDQLNFIHSIETDTPLKGDNGMFNQYKKAFADDYKIMQSVDPNAPYRKNYFTHNGLWKDPKAAEEFYNKWAQEQFGGGKKFFKTRSFPTVYEGLKAGLELKEVNPEKLFVNNHLNVLKAKMADDFAKEMASKGMPKGAVQAVIDRYMDAGLKNNAIYNTIREANTGLNMFQLGLSAFHFTATSVNSITSKAALGIKELTQGRILNAGKNIAETPISIFTDFARGSKAFKDNPELEKNISTILRGGGTVEKMGGYNTNQWGKMMESFGEGKYVRGAARSPFAVMEKISSPLMNYYVPRIKIGSFLSDASSELERIGLNATQDEQRAVLSKVWDSADNRFGQLVQDNLMWNQTFKDVMNLDTRSLGWNLGTIRELGGGVKDVVGSKEGSKIPFSKLLDDLKSGKGISDRTAYTIALPVVTGVIATAIMKLHGTTPQSALDYFYPRTGDKTKQGYDERLSIPGYMKDVFSYKNNPTQTLLNKQSPAATVGAGLFELAHTGGIKDFYGNWAVDPYASIEDRSKQFLSYAVSQFTPFSVSSSNQRVDQSIGAKVESGLGFQPASSAITKGSEVTDLATMWRDISPNPPKTPADAAAFDAKMQSAPGKQGKTPEEAKKETDFLTNLRKTTDGSPERTKAIQDYVTSLPAAQRSSLTYKLMLAGISTKGVTTSDDIIAGKPIYQNIQKIKSEQGDDAAQQAVENLSDSDYKLYTKVRSSENAKDTNTLKAEIHPEMEATAKKVQDLIGQGKQDEAQSIVDGMSDEDYKLYGITKKKLNL